MNAKLVKCESIERKNWGPFGGMLNTCNMNGTTSIYSCNFTILKELDETTGAMSFSENKKIVCLPLDMFKVFPYLKVIHAGRCSIKSILKENFRNLSKLKLLWLEHNQITQITDDTFNGLLALEFLDLRE